MTPPCPVDVAVGVPRLTIELVPSASWGASLAKTLRGKRWDLVRRETYRRADYRCEVCGGVGPRHPVEAHEIWTYDTDAGIQRLAVMVALCPACHNVKHIGRAFNLGYGDEALAHLAAVNGWTLDDAGAYVDAAFDQWAERSAHGWTLDLAALAAYGIEPPSDVELSAGRTLAARIIEAEARLDDSLTPALPFPRQVGRGRSAFGAPKPLR